MENKPKRIVGFPAFGCRGDPGEPVNREPVRIIDEKHEPHPKFGGIHHTFRLNLDPWDLQRIIRAANEMGLQGKRVMGFGYDRDGQNIHVVPKPDVSISENSD